MNSDAFVLCFELLGDDLDGQESRKWYTDEFFSSLHYFQPAILEDYGQILVNLDSALGYNTQAAPRDLCWGHAMDLDSLSLRPFCELIMAGARRIQ